MQQEALTQRKTAFQTISLLSEKGIRLSKKANDYWISIKH